MPPELEILCGLLGKLTRGELVAIIAVIGGLPLVIVVVNDLWKQRRVRHAERRGERIPSRLRENRIDWRMVCFLAVAFAAYIFVLANPELKEGDFGRFNPIIKHLFHDFEPRR